MSGKWLSCQPVSSRTRGFKSHSRRHNSSSLNEHYQTPSLCRGKKFVLNQSTLVSYRRWGPFTLTKRANEGSIGPTSPDHESGSRSGRIPDRALLQRPLLCREETRSKNFWRGVPPVEPVLGLDSFYSPGSGDSPVFVMGQVSVQVTVQDRRGQNVCPDRRSRLVLGESLDDSIFPTLKRSMLVRRPRREL